MPAPFYAAWLRVYVPLPALPAGERDRWRTYAERSRSPDRREAARLEHEAALAALVHGRLQVPARAAGQAIIEQFEGITYICPLGLQLRVWEAAAQVRAGLPVLLADALLPAELAARAEVAVAARGPSLPPAGHVCCSPWSVPLAWLALVSAANRCASGLEVRYVTELRRARRRAAGVLQVLGQALPDAPTTAVLAQLDGWLAHFPAGSRVELDYGTVTELLTEAHRAQDPSPEDLAEAVAELAAGRPAAAAAAYGRIQDRWRPLQLREHAS